jgi:hypothetical protein
MPAKKKNSVEKTRAKIAQDKKAASAIIAGKKKTPSKVPTMTVDEFRKKYKVPVSKNLTQNTVNNILKQQGLPPISLKKKPALSKTTSKTIFGPDAAYGDKKKRRSEQPRTTKYAIAQEDGRKLRYRKVNYK